MCKPLLFWLVPDYVHDVHPHTDVPDGPRKLAVSTLSLANGTTPARSPVNGVAGGQPLSQRKRLLKAPTLAELDSSDSDVSVLYFLYCNNPAKMLNQTSRWSPWELIVLASFSYFRRTKTLENPTAAPAYPPHWLRTHLQSPSWAKRVRTIMKYTELAVQQKHVSDSLVRLQLNFCTPFCLFPVPPKFLPISSTPQPDKRFAPQRRHSIEKEAPTSVQSFLAPSRQNSKSLVTAKKPFFSSMFLTCSCLQSCFPWVDPRTVNEKNLV